jgi:hypothetical protein
MLRVNLWENDLVWTLKVVSTVRDVKDKLTAF